MLALVFVGACAGLSAGAISVFLAHIAPRFGAGNFIRDADRTICFSRELSRREAHYIGIFVHLIVSAVIGGTYAFAVARHWLPDFGWLLMAGLSIVLFTIIGVVVLPLEGHGMFGVREDAWFPVDLCISSVAWGLLYGGLIRLWLP